MKILPRRNPPKDFLKQTQDRTRNMSNMKKLRKRALLEFIPGHQDQQLKRKWIFSRFEEWRETLVWIDCVTNWVVNWEANWCRQCGGANETVLAGNLEKTHQVPTSLCGLYPIHTHVHCRHNVLYQTALINTDAKCWSLNQRNTESLRWELIPQIVWVRWDNREDGDAIGDGIQEWRMPEFHSALSDHPGPEYALGPILAGIWKWVVSKIKPKYCCCLFVCMKNEVNNVEVWICMFMLGSGRLWRKPVAEYSWEHLLLLSTRCV